MGKYLWRTLCILLVLTMLPVVSLAQETAHTDAHTSEHVVSGYYTVDTEKGYITGIMPETPASIASAVCLPAGGKAEGETLATGSAITFPDGTTYTAIVTGDLNGDSTASISDMLMIKSYVLGNDLPETALAAADLNFDGLVTVSDFLQIKAYLLNISDVPVAKGTQKQDLILLTPNAEFTWDVIGAAYKSDDPAVVDFREDGTAVAGSIQGTTFLYALDESGNILARQLVTVLEEPLAVTFPQSQYILTQGQTLTVPYTCNHPIEPRLVWQTSDPAVVQVEKGRLTAGELGEATVTATLPDGTAFSLSVKVAGAISDWMDIGQHRYYFDENGEIYRGWLELDGDTYYLKENGVMAIGQVTIDGVDHFFTSTGKHVLMPNPWHPIPEDYQVELVTVGYVQVSAECAGPLKEMVAAGKKAGYHLNVSSGYRSMAVQQFLWDKNIQQFMAQGYNRATAEKLTGQSVAIPGHSEHQLGLAADISKGNEPVMKWIRENCWDYGFILRYPTDRMDITGIMYEPWHFRYVGKELAAELKESGLCMEEYMDMLTRQEQEKEPPAIS